MGRSRSFADTMQLHTSGEAEDPPEVGDMNEESAEMSSEGGFTQKDADELLKRIRRFDEKGEYDAALKEAQSIESSLAREQRDGSLTLKHIIQGEIQRLEEKIKLHSESRKKRKNEFLFYMLLPSAALVPAILLNLRNFICNHQLWEKCTMFSKHGTYNGVPAHYHLLMLFAFTVIYALTFHRELRGSAKGWISTAGVWIVRICFLILIYLIGLGNIYFTS